MEKPPQARVFRALQVVAICCTKSCKKTVKNGLFLALQLLFSVEICLKFPFEEASMKNMRQTTTLLGGAIALTIGLGAQAQDREITYNLSLIHI